MRSKYKLRYLPRFEEDMLEILEYIDKKLQNPSAAQKLIDDVEKAIIERSYAPLSFEPYHSVYNREYDYYRIYIRNYVIYYVVIGDIMEVRRIIYSGRNRDKLI